MLPTGRNGQDSSPTRNLGNLNRCGATEWVVGTGGSADSCREDSSLGESNEGSERKEGEHLSRTEELVFPKNVEPHQGWKKTGVARIASHL